ncbi:MAG: hypothetical protein GY941_08780, partial [Planctomycetes bacterium]|nr:hypothetical protein [Planctomycetota bacterium]
MATFIHHGDPGSYKSFSAVQKHIIPQLRAGRTIVTNIRGLNSKKRIQKAINEKFPKKAKIIYVNCEKEQGRDKMRKWFHWVPKGSFIVIDEAQKIYSSKYKLESLDYPGDVQNGLSSNEAADRDIRPATIQDAFDEQRHYNFDLIIITTHIAKLHKEIRQVAELAYLHRNTSGFLPWIKNRWRQKQHDPDTTGKANTKGYDPVSFKADPRIFNCYESTKTGVHSDAGVNKNLLYQIKVPIAMLLIAIVAGFYYVPKSIENLTPKNNKDNIQVSSNIVNADTVNDSNRTSFKKSAVNIVEKSQYITFYDKNSYQRISIIGNVNGNQLLEFVEKNEEFQFTQSHLESLGYRFK